MVLCLSWSLLRLKQGLTDFPRRPLGEIASGGGGGDKGVSKS